MESAENNNQAGMNEGNEADAILVVRSKLREFIAAQSGMNTSASVAAILSDKIRVMATEAIAKAKADGRKTVMDRDF